MGNAETIYNLAKILGCEAELNEPMSKHTTFRIGGKAKAYIKIGNLSRLSTILRECTASKTKFFLFGNGSNLLIDDDGMDCAVLRLVGDFKDISLIDDETIYCGAGCSVASLCKFACKYGLSGLEFAWGIPGTVGGAVFMNAGAYGGEMKNVVVSVSHITPYGEIGKTTKDELDFGYRTSVYRQNGYIITGVTLKLKKDSFENIRKKMDDYLARRFEKQPLEFPSAGSVFKRPEGAFAGGLIEQCGFKGKMVGGAQVSEKHAGFIINRANASAKDVKNLIKEIQTTVKEKTGYDLECELIII